LSNNHDVKITPAEGKLGVLIPGLGAVTTTFIAEIEAVRRGLGKPIGSLTQLATIRLGKRTENRSPLIKDFVPLAGLDDLVVGTWDIFEDDVKAWRCRCSTSSRTACPPSNPCPRCSTGNTSN
jgi:myo-inositol-1-phosphate synthase